MIGEWLYVSPVESVLSVPFVRFVTERSSAFSVFPSLASDGDQDVSSRVMEEGLFLIGLDWTNI